MCKAREPQSPYMKGSEEMDEMPTTTEYLLRMVLELIDKSASLEELREAIERILNKA